METIAESTRFKRGTNTDCRGGRHLRMVDMVLVRIITTGKLLHRGQAMSVTTNLLTCSMTRGCLLLASNHTEQSTACHLQAYGVEDRMERESLDQRKVALWRAGMLNARHRICLSGQRRPNRRIDLLTKRTVANGSHLVDTRAALRGGHTGRADLKGTAATKTARKWKGGGERGGKEKRRRAGLTAM